MGKFFQDICYVQHTCAQCGRVIKVGDEEWEHKYMQNGYWCSEYYHPECC